MAHCAAKDGNLDALIAMGDVSTILNEQQENVLHIAAHFGQFEIVEYLSNKYPHLLTSISNTSKTVLHHAVESLCLPIVQKIVSLCDHLIDSRDSYDYTPLHHAIHLKFSEAAIFMISAKPESLNQTVHGATTLLHCAAVSIRNDVMVRYLCSVCPALLRRQDDRGRTALGIALFTRSLDIVKLLFTADPTAIDISDKYGILPIFHVSDVSIMTYLLEVSPHAIHHKRPKTNENLLHCSWNTPDPALTRKLLEFCPDLLQEVSDRGECALEVAFRKRAKIHVETILKFKPDFVCTDKKGNTVLHMAVQCCDSKIVWAVFQKCRDNLYCENTSGKTPFCLAIEYEKYIVVEILKRFITFDMAFAMRSTCNHDCETDLQTFAKEECATLSNFILPDIADIVFEYLSDVKKHKKNVT